MDPQTDKIHFAELRMKKPLIPLSEDIRFHRLVKILSELSSQRREALLRTLKANNISELLRNQEVEKHG